MNIFRNNKGFTAAIAAVIGSVVLAIGLALLSITLKEILLSSTIRNSTRAFFSADSGVECALYLDGRRRFATSTASDISTDPIYCMGTNIIDVWSVEATGSSAETTFSIDNQDVCATVVVSKDSSDTVIESRGYNTCDIGNARRVERGLRAQY